VKIEDSVILYRAIGLAEYNSILEKGMFSLRPNGLESKYFGMDFDETLDFANRVFNVHVVAIVEATIARDVLDLIGDFTRVDPSVFKSGTVEIHEEHLDRFNKAVIDIKHIY
jgi:hypothetical protein